VGEVHGACRQAKEIAEAKLKGERDISLGKKEGRDIQDKEVPLRKTP